MKTKVAGIIFALMFIFCIVSANAAEIKPVRITPNLSFSGTTAHCSAKLTDIDKEITLILSLWQGNAFIKSWSSSGKDSVQINAYQSVTKGKTYTLRLSGLVDGKSISAVSVSGTC